MILSLVKEMQMEKSVKCPECGETKVPEFGMCPTCSYKYRPFDIQKQAAEEAPAAGFEKRLTGESNLAGKVKVFGFAFALFIIIVMLLNKFL